MVDGFQEAAGEDVLHGFLEQTDLAGLEAMHHLLVSQQLLQLTRGLQVVACILGVYFKLKALQTKS